MDEQRSKKLEQVRKLLDKAADAATTEAEANALREKADDLMLAYAISEYEANQRVDKNVRQKPERRHIQVVGYNNPLKTQIVSLFGVVSWHCRCREVYTGLRDQKSGSMATVIGFPSDLDYLELLFTSLLTQMAQHLEPKPDPTQTEKENLVMLKEAGMKWERIHALIHPDVPWERRHGVRYTKVYTDYCKSHERERMYTSPQQYQRNYADGFIHEVSTRLQEIRRRQQQQGQVGSGMELALRDEVKEAAADAFGRTKAVTLGGRSKFDASAYGKGKFDGSRADLGQGRVGNTKELT